MILRSGQDDGGRRLDRILRKALPGLPLSALHRLLRKGLVLADGRPARGHDRIPAGTEISLPLSTDMFHSGTVTVTVPGAAVIDTVRILWEGAGLLVLDKPAGLAVHGGSIQGRSSQHDTLEKRVRAYLADKLTPSLSFRPGPLHRLDKPVSGIIVFSAALEGARWFSALLKEGKLRKRYLAVLEGEITKDEVWEEHLLRDHAAGKTLTVPASASAVETRITAFPDSAVMGARRALTRIAPLESVRRRGSAYTLARLEIETGRTHQIRAQAAHHGHPLAGDRKYGGRPLPGVLCGKPGAPPLSSAQPAGGFFLHAAELELPELPQTTSGAFPRLIKAPLPESFERMLEELFRDFDTHIPIK